MGRKLSMAGALAFLAVGLTGCFIGIARLAAGDVPRGMADLIIGSFVAIYGVCQLFEEC